MRKILLALMVLGVAAGLGGCTRYKTPVVPPQGFVWTNLSAPLMYDFDQTAVAGKKGEASTFYFHIPFLTLADFGWGEAGLKQAAAAGGIKQVAFADYRILMILGIFGTFTVTAYGD